MQKRDYLTKFMYNEETFEERLKIAYEELTTHGYSEGYAIFKLHFEESRQKQNANWESQYPEIKFNLDTEKNLEISWSFTS